MARSSGGFPPRLTFNKISSYAEDMEGSKRDSIWKLMLPVCAELLIRETTASEPAAIIVDVEGVILILLDSHSGSPTYILVVSFAQPHQWAENQLKERTAIPSRRLLRPRTSDHTGRFRSFTCLRIPSSRWLSCWVAYISGAVGIAPIFGARRQVHLYSAPRHVGRTSSDTARPAN